MKPTICITGIALCSSIVARAQQAETVHASVILNRHGDRTPLISGNSTLTPLGAQQMFSAGQAFRSRYLTPASNLSRASFATLNPYQLDNIQLYAMGLIDDYVSASAQAFLQGLYPPTNRTALVLNGANILSNGTVTQAPLGGYQYPQLQSVCLPKPQQMLNDDLQAEYLKISVLDYNWIWLSGNDFCPAWETTTSRFATSQETINNQQANAELYRKVRNLVFGRGTPSGAVSYLNAYNIYDYVYFQYTHNQSTKSVISAEDLAKLRMLASAQQYAVLGNLSASGRTQGDRILAIAGLTLASKVMELLESNIDSFGIVNKISPLFSYKNAMMSFAALAQLPGVEPNFYGLPNLGSSMVFELFSLGDNSLKLPDYRDLRVRFLFRNGTDASNSLTAYPLFGRPRSQTEMTWTEFKAGMAKISVNGLKEWCSICSSEYYVCSIISNNTSLDGGNNPKSGSGLRPAVAGVIGAIVTLAVIAIASAGAVLIGGVRLHRSPNKRRSDLAGFKGAEKLASDADLTSGKVVDSESGKGHERIGSWELKNKSNTPATHSTPDDLDVDQESTYQVGDLTHEDVEDLQVNPFSDPVTPREAF
ncbi:MAG: hypothetical protein M1814_000782 [Vezdaea aestivalis]|nr:MAG: hypothetical protein M1814_000782 [Vezdaea aestivalis]